MECPICKQEIPAVMVEPHQRTHEKLGDTIPVQTVASDAVRTYVFLAFCALVGLTGGAILAILR